MKKKCKLCRHNTETCNSHALPDSLFNSIFKSKNGKGTLNGQAILLDGTENKPIRRTQDSWSEYQLCKRCEIKLNESYEAYSLQALRGVFGFEKVDDGVYFSDVKTQKIRHFIAAILWRASISKHDSYTAVRLSENINESLRFHLNTSTKIPNKTLSVKGFKLVDNTNGGFSIEEIRDSLFSPFVRVSFDINNKPMKSICFLFLGYFFEVFMSGVPTNDYHYDFIGYNKQRYMFPFLEITDIPEVFELMVIAYRKYKEGLSTINC